MQHQLHLLFFCFLLSVTPACNQKEKNFQKEIELQKIDLKDFEQNPISNEEIIQALHFIKLETHDSCLIGNVLDVKMARQNIYISDDKNVLWVFGENGEYKGRIGSQGQGPAEYSRMNRFYINETKGYLGLLDMGSNTVVRYTFDNQFIDKIRFKFDLLCDGVTLLNKGETLIILSSNGKKYPFNYAAYNESDFSFKSYQIPFEVFGEETGGNRALLAHNVGNNSYVLAMNSDTIYQWKDDSLKPAYLVEGGFKHLTTEVLRENGPYFAAVEAGYKLCREKGYSQGIENLCATNDYWYFKYPATDTDVFWDRVRNKGRLFCRPADGSFLSALSWEFHSTTSNFLIRCFSLEIVEAVKEDLKKAKHPDYHTLYDDLPEDANPVVVLLDYSKLFK